MINKHAADASRLPDVAWRKSSYSGHGGGACVEAGTMWRKSTYSGHGGGECVEVGAAPVAIAVRDSKNPTGPALLFTANAWAQFLSRIAAPR